VTDAAQATERLTTALLEAARQKQRPHCGDPATHHLWLSDSAAERRVAAILCAGCPVFDPCGEAATARAEPFGVWGGRDFTRKPYGQAARRA
jgi:hypothetical protein